jgi:hypothetical protein
MLIRTRQTHSYYCFLEKFLNRELEFAKAPSVPRTRVDMF